MTIHQFNSLGLPKMREPEEAAAAQPEPKPPMNTQPSPPSWIFLLLVFGIMLSIVTGMVVLVAGWRGWL